MGEETTTSQRPRQLSGQMSRLTVDAANAPAMPESLPADDGMGHLRTRIHEIRGIKASNEDKARLMHGLMTERYNFLQPQSPSSIVSHDRPFTPTSGQSLFSEPPVSPMSSPSDMDPDNPFNIGPGDAERTYRTRPSAHPELDEDNDADVEDEGALGCVHYQRNVKVQCFECRRWFPCRHCHDEAVPSHNLNRRKTQNMLCMVCGTPQPASEFCMQCATQAARYYCDICKLWDNDARKKIYHCIDCGICRKGAGLGKDYFHCKVSRSTAYAHGSPPRNAMFASRLRGRIRTSASSGPPIATARFAASTSSTRLQPSSLCLAGTTCTGRATTYTWRRRTNAHCARRAW